jgi:hypothetical protein
MTIKSQYIPFPGEKFRAFCKEGGGEFHNGKFGDLTCTRQATTAHVFASPEKGTPWAGKEIFKLYTGRWKFWPAEKIKSHNGRILDSAVRIL